MLFLVAECHFSLLIRLTEALALRGTATLQETQAFQSMRLLTTSHGIFYSSPHF